MDGHLPFVRFLPPRSSARGGLESHGENFEEDKKETHFYGLSMDCSRLRSDINISQKPHLVPHHFRRSAIKVLPRALGYMEMYENND